MVDLKRDKLTHAQKAQAALMKAIKHCKDARDEAPTLKEHAEWSLLVDMIEQTALRATDASPLWAGKDRANSK